MLATLKRCALWCLEIPLALLQWAVLLVVRVALIVLGLMVVAVAIPFAVPGLSVSDLRPIVNLPRWAWLFGNDYDGLDGDKRYWWADNCDAYVLFGLLPLRHVEQTANLNHMSGAAYGYGTEKRVLLLHGPVGSAKSTIARLIKKGVEWYSKTEGGAIYTFKWVDEEGKFADIMGNQRELRSPMHEEPLKLVPEDMRASLIEELNRGNKGEYKVGIRGDLDPASLRSVTCKVVWPVGSGRWLTVPEVDQCGWFTLDEAGEKLMPAQRAFLRRLSRTLGKQP